MRAEMLNSILSDLNGSSADIEASAVLSTDGLMMASLLPAGMDEDRVGAMSAAMLSLGDRTAEELARGALEQVLIKGATGYILMTHAGNDAVVDGQHFAGTVKNATAVNGRILIQRTVVDS